LTYYKRKYSYLGKRGRVKRIRFRLESAAGGAGGPGAIVQQGVGANSIAALLLGMILAVATEIV
jgi:hypothetical protein